MLDDQMARAPISIVRRQQQIKHLYARYEKHIPLGAFIAGFLWDTLTLTRIDKWSDNLILLGYALAAGLLIVIIGRIQLGRISRAWVVRRLNVITAATHFFLGGMLSSYVVFYFKSAGVGKSLIFVGLLVGLMLANEFFSHRLRNLKLLTAIYYFCCFAFLTFFLPVITRTMSDALFITSGLVSFVPLVALTAFIHGKRWRDQILHAALLPLVIFVTLVSLYFLNWMPPVPLALKEGGIYRSVKRIGDKYEVIYRAPSWWQFWQQDERDFHYITGDTIYCFTAVFAPTKLNEQVVHEWQQKDANGRWAIRGRHSYPIVGGRDGGYRGYSLKRNIGPGQWRVEVKTTQGRLLGRLSFDVIAVQQRPSQMKVAYR